MALIRVPRPSTKKAMNPDRPVSSLLLTQVRHLQHAERRLPLRYRTEIYTHAIRTEGQAAQYIREVTEAIHQAHEDAVALRTKPAHKRKAGLTIATAQRPARKRRAKVKAAGKKKKR
jgi:hypothetical protein